MNKLPKTQQIFYNFFYKETIVISLLTCACTFSDLFCLATKNLTNVLNF